MNISPSTSRERKQLFIETLLNATNKVSKVSHQSGLDAIATGIAKVAGRTEKDMILALSELFPDLAFGQLLDRAAANLGTGKRFGQLGSSTYVKLVADPGTTYIPGTHVAQSTDGLRFNFTDIVVIPQEGYQYALVSSVDSGSQTDVGALTISRITPAPAGHKSILNEVKASGGRDIEDDETYRGRIKDTGNLFATGTLAMIEQLGMLANPKVLRAFNYGVNKAGKSTIALATQNGSDLTTTELADITDLVAPFLSLKDSRWYGTRYIGVQFVNVTYQPIDVSFRVLLDNTVDSDTVRQNIQVSMTKYLDLRFFNPSSQKVEWDNLLEIVKSTAGVKYVPDQFFFPRVDVAVSTYKLPRLRGFAMLDMDGHIISNLTGTLSPVYYPAIADFSLISTVLQNL